MADGILYTSNGSAVITVGANLVNQNITGNLTVKAIIANNSIGSAGQTLTSNGSATYWSTITGGSGTVTSVATGNGMTGGPVTTTGTVSVLANTGVVANATGVFVNATYIGTLSANNTTFVNSKTEGNLNVNNATTAYSKAESALNVNSALTANNSTNLGGVAAASYQTTAGLSANVATLTANNANFVKANNGITSNSLGVFVTQGTGTVVNATGVHVNATYIGTLTANNATNLGGVAAASYVQNTDSRTLSGNLVISGTSFTPSSNTILLGNSTQRWVLSANTGSFSGAVSGITTLGAGNTTITGSLVTSGSVTISNGAGTYQAGSIYSDGNWGMLYRAAQPTPVAAQFAWKSSDDVTEYMRISPTGNVGIGNTAPAHKLRVTGTTSLAGAVSDITTLAAGNTTITGFANVTTTIQGGSSLTIAGALSGVTTAAMGNTTITGFANVTTSVNSALLTVGSSFIANTTGAYHTGTMNAASHTVGSSFIANSTAIVGTGYANVTTSVNSALLTVGTAFIANTTGAYHTGTVNAASLTVGSSVVANTTRLAIGTAVGIQANGGIGTAGQVLTSNGTTIYWSTVSGGTSNSVYMKGGAATIGTLASEGTNIFRVNANTLNYNTTIAAGENAQATGPLSVAGGITLTVASGARVSIV
jgi:hypothetical protein